MSDRPHISHICLKASLPPPLFSVSKIDGSRLAVPARHPALHMLAAMFSHPSQLEADNELRHLNTYSTVPTHGVSAALASCPAHSSRVYYVLLP